MPNKKSAPGRRPTSSGAVGGPATASGTRYQVDFAIRQALEAISHALSDPFGDFRIFMEPRVPTPDGSATCWDVGLSHPNRVTEAKLKPKRTDIIAWLDRVDAATHQQEALEFELFYGRGASPLLSAIEKLCRIAKEADGNSDNFQQLLTIERDSDTDIVLQHLVTQPHLSLLRVRLAPSDPHRLDDEIQFRLRQLVREPDRAQLYNFLFAKFAKGLEQRATYQVRDLMQEANGNHIEFFGPPPSLPRHLSFVLSGAIYILQHCETGLPTEVLARAIGCTTREVDDRLSEHSGASGLNQDEGCWKVGPVRRLMFHDDGAQLIAAALRQLLDFISSHKKNTVGWRQVGNAIALAKICAKSDPELVSGLFWKLDKLLKRTGNKQLVLEVAKISLEAARRPPLTETKKKGQAVALICGVAWVSQRRGRLAEARGAGERSLQLGSDIEWYRNTAFCLKCLGRLFRMEAEQTDRHEPRFHELLDASVDYLERAIEAFPKATELSEAERRGEVGDCQSLLARTYLVGGKLQTATAAARQAIERITDTSSKDYADLQILLGDLTLRQHDAKSAVRFYDDAIKAAGGDDVEESEIAARAYFQKGLAMKSSVAFDQAAEIWIKLEEDELAAEATWHSMLLTERVPAAARQILGQERVMTRVEAIEMYEADVGRLSGSRGQRSEPAEGYWKEVLPDARKNAAVRHSEW